MTGKEESDRLEKEMKFNLAMWMTIYLSGAIAFAYQAIKIKCF